MAIMGLLGLHLTFSSSGTKCVFKLKFAALNSLQLKESFFYEVQNPDYIFYSCQNKRQWNIIIKTT